MKKGVLYMVALSCLLWPSYGLAEPTPPTPVEVVNPVQLEQPVQVSMPAPPQAPAAPALVSVTDDTATVRLFALPQGQDVSTYTVYVDGEPVTDIAEGASGPYEIKLVNLKPGNHYVSVTATNTAGEGLASKPLRVEVGPVNPPAGLKVTNTAATAVALTWEPVPGASEYVITYDGKEVTTNGTDYTLTGLNPSAAYTIAVTARQREGNTSSPAALQVRTEPAPEAPGLDAYSGAAAKYLSGGLTAVYILAAVGLAFAIANAAGEALRNARWRWLRW